MSGQIEFQTGLGRGPQPSRTVGMDWRKTSPLAKQLLKMSDVIRHATAALHGQPGANPLSALPSS